MRCALGALRAGAVDYLLKPLKEDEVLKAIDYGAELEMTA